MTPLTHLQTKMKDGKTPLEDEEVVAGAAEVEGAAADIVDAEVAVEAAAVVAANDRMLKT